MIVVLTGPTKNSGDYLIADRGKKLLSYFVDEEIIELNRFKGLEDKLNIINKSKVLILCGGPAYDSKIYPNIYPLVKDLSKIKVPIIPFGIGWSGKPMNNFDKFKFSDESIQFLNDIHKKNKYSSCRDVLTKKILKNHGYNNVIMTGCPVWYDLDFIGKEYSPPKHINNIVISTPADPRLIIQFLKLQLLIKNKFNSSNIHIVFHRGIFPDKKTSLKSSVIYILMATFAKLFGGKIYDVSYSLKKMDFYKECDFHIGYRVHAHLLFLSKRKPSLLVNEDGRGLGMVESMNLPIFNRDDNMLLKKIDSEISNQIKTSFKSFNKTFKYIDNKFNDMKKFLLTIK